jgi:hypothetical protein
VKDRGQCDIGCADHVHRFVEGHLQIESRHAVLAGQIIEARNHAEAPRVDLHYVRPSGAILLEINAEDP